MRKCNGKIECGEDHRMVFYCTLDEGRKGLHAAQIPLITVAHYEADAITKLFQSGREGTSNIPSMLNRTQIATRSSKPINGTEWDRFLGKIQPETIEE